MAYNEIHLIALFILFKLISAKSVLLPRQGKSASDWGRGAVRECLSRASATVRYAMGLFGLLARFRPQRADHRDDLADMLSGDVAAVLRQLEPRPPLLVLVGLSSIRFLVGLSLPERVFAPHRGLESIGSVLRRCVPVIFHFRRGGTRALCGSLMMSIGACRASGIRGVARLRFLDAPSRAGRVTLPTIACPPSLTDTC